MERSDQMETEAIRKAKKAKEAAHKLGNLTTEVKDKALLAMAKALAERAGDILKANQKDIDGAKKKELPAAMIERLTLNEKRIKACAEGLEQVATLRDPVGEVVGGWKRPNGLEIQKVRVPLGVVGIIYESRPNVTVDAAGLCLKSGNAVILRGGSEAIGSNKALVDIISRAAGSRGIPEGAIQLIETTDRAAAVELMKLNGLIDALIPRGGGGLIKTVVETATIPVIETGVGNCHVYVDEHANLKMAEEIVVNAKCQRPSVCNAAETLLVHKAVADEFLPAVFKKLKEKGVELRGDEKCRKVDASVKSASDGDWFAEYLDLILAVKVVKNLDDAISHINHYSSHHTEAIVTDNLLAAQKFTKEVDSAAVFVNASTRFTDGFEFGLGAEIGISTQKLHARGPMGLEALTSTKFVVYGSGQLRT